uniref:Uncharacterized protein n=1 Tax=Chenopodium quinoa TaxID=63459 RepID=A0A803N8W9_CHEQI
MLRNRRGGNIGVSNPRQSDSRAEKKSREDESQVKPPSPKNSDTHEKTMDPSTVYVVKNVGDRWQPELDVCQNESLIAIDTMQGGALGYRIMRNLTLPMDRPAGSICLLAAQHMHDLMKEQHHQSSSVQQSLETALNNAKKALNGIKQAKANDDAESKSQCERVGIVTNLEKKVEELNSQLAEKIVVANRLPLVQNELLEAKTTISNLEAKIQKMKADKPGIRRRVVVCYLTSAEFATKLQDRFVGGWTATQRCIAQVAGWKKEVWAKVKKAFKEEAHKIPFGFEQQEFIDEDLLNLVPTANDGPSNPSILDSPEPENPKA